MINYTEKIPNNVDLGRDRVLQRALEHWQPAYMGWWYDMGPNESHNYEVYLRTAISVEPDGWAQFGYVKMPEYRWGIFLQPRDEKREVNFGVHKGQPAWQEVPGEYRSTLRRVIVTQGDTEPASVEQQRMLGASCPSIAMAARKPNPCSRGDPETPIIRAFLALSMSRRRTGWPFICLRFSRIAMANSSFVRSRNRVLIRLPALAGSCSPRKHTTCLSARRELAALFSGLVK